MNAFHPPKVISGEMEGGWARRSGVSPQSTKGRQRGRIEVSSLSTEIRGLRRWSGLVVEPLPARNENVDAGSACPGPGTSREYISPALPVLF